MACSDPSQFRSLVAPYCTDLRSDTCTWALVEAGGAFGPGCLDLSIVAIPELGMPPYRDYVCPRSTGALARLCGPPKQQVASNTGAGARTGSSYGTLAAGLGVSTAALGLTTGALYRKVNGLTESTDAYAAHITRHEEANVKLQEGIARLYELIPTDDIHTDDHQLNRLTEDHQLNRLTESAIRDHLAGNRFVPRLV
jgi:hypothetical protein